MNADWQPLLSGEAAAQALAAASEIAEATVRGAPLPPDGPPSAAAAAWENALAAGRAGRCLLPAYLALHGAGTGAAESSLALLDQARDAAAALPMTASLYLGFPGISWSAAHLAERLLTPADDGLEEVDRILLRALERGPWQGSYNLFIGLVGLGVYARERLPRPAAARCLEAVVAQLARRAEHGPRGTAFFTPAGQLIPRYAAEYPHGTYALGMAEGVAGVIALLGCACQSGIAVQKARPLLADTVRWLLAHEHPPERGYHFPSFYWPGSKASGGQLAWWMGDLGTAMSLLLAARGAEEPAWEVAARRLALAAAARSQRRLAEVGLAVGNAGVGHLFNRFYQATGERSAATAARLWLRRTLAQRTPGRGIAGFCAPPFAGGGWSHDPGFLNGATATGLALLAAASPVAPAWDRVLLLS